MIYIAIETQLAWIREDLELIKQQLCHVVYIKPTPECNECNLAKLFNLSTCPEHAPELNMRINFS
jgi:hypothetical protein